LREPTVRRVGQLLAWDIGSTTTRVTGDIRQFKVAHGRRSSTKREAADANYISPSWEPCLPWRKKLLKEQW
jgi:hypothetical protein